MARERWNWLVNDNIEECLVRLARAHLRGRLIDIGCGMKPYRKLLAGLVSEHVGVDHAGSLHAKDAVDKECTAYDIDFPAGSFDSAVCTFVLEHLEEPEQALRECLRVLKPGGVAIYLAPFIWHLHEAPRDFYRYSKFGLRHLFEKAGFEVVEIAAMSGFWLTFGQLFVYNMYRYNRGPLRRLHVVDALGWMVQRVSGLLDRCDRAEEWTHAYSVVARKPAGNPPA